MKGVCVCVRPVWWVGLRWCGAKDGEWGVCLDRVTSKERIRRPTPFFLCDEEGSLAPTPPPLPQSETVHVPPSRVPASSPSRSSPSPGRP